MSLQVTKCRQIWIPGVKFNHVFTCQYYFFLSLMLFYVLFQCVYCMFSAMAVLSPPPRRWVCLFSYRELLYLCVLFFIFLYGYLLHYVVYNTVVCINTIIYFSMEKKKIQRQITTSLENETPAYWSMFFEQIKMMFSPQGEKKKLAPCKPENWNLWPLCIHSHVSFLSPL